MRRFAVAMPCRKVVGLCSKVAALCSKVAALCSKVAALCRKVAALCSKVGALCWKVGALCRKVAALRPNDAEPAAGMVANASGRGMIRCGAHRPSAFAEPAGRRFHT